VLQVRLDSQGIPVRLDHKGYRDFKESREFKVNREFRVNRE
jgi:hypothetical protein